MAEVGKGESEREEGEKDADEYYDWGEDAAGVASVRAVAATTGAEDDGRSCDGENRNLCAC